MISQTSGHADFRQRVDTPQRRWTGRLDALERLGYGLVADGPDEVAAGAREQLRLGATQLKLAAGGGVSSNYDPIDSVQYSEAELRAAVQAATDFGTYVAVHAYTPTAIRRSVDAGVLSIEHAQLIDEPTMKLVAERGVYLSPQAYLFGVDSPVASLQTPSQRAKATVVAAGLDRMMQLAKKYKVKVAFGTDLFGAPQMFGAEPQEFGARLRWFSAGEILQQATSINGDLLAMSGTRNPYGRLGVIEEGALADLLILDGDPLEDIRILESPDQTIRVIVKDGRVIKTTL
jgi:imidazolonepropionase-like amidohydrolase